MNSGPGLAPSTVQYGWLPVLCSTVFVVQEYNYECFMADPRIRTESKAAVAACGAPAAGAFLSSLPRKPELKLDEI